jgi:hypothetical protein
MTTVSTNSATGTQTNREKMTAECRRSIEIISKDDTTTMRPSLDAVNYHVMYDTLPNRIATFSLIHLEVEKISVTADCI